MLSIQEKKRRIKSKGKERKRIKKKMKGLFVMLVATSWLEAPFLCSHLIFVICGENTERSINILKGY